MQRVTKSQAQRLFWLLLLSGLARLFFSPVYRTRSLRLSPDSPHDRAENHPLFTVANTLSPFYPAKVKLGDRLKKGNRITLE